MGIWFKDDQFFQSKPILVSSHIVSINLYRLRLEDNGTTTLLYCFFLLLDMIF